MDLPMPWSFYRKQWTPLPPIPTGPLLKDKVLIMTGGNSGIGLEASKQLAALSPVKIILAVRSVSSGEEAAKALRAKHPSVEIEVWELDLCSFSSIKAFAERVNASPRVDILFNNAGVNPAEAPFKATDDGYERTLQTNLIAPILLTLLVLPALQRAPASRVIFTGSDGHVYADPELIKRGTTSEKGILATFNAPDQYDHGKRYFRSKLLLQMAMRGLIPALPSLVLVNANPGLCYSNLGREYDVSFNLATIRMVSWYVSQARSVAKGASNLTTAAVHADQSYEYWSECAPAPSEAVFLSGLEGMQATKQLWTELCTELEKLSPECTKVLKA